jgi:glycosyltransferase involved in cell wall biosynthesis
MASPEVTIAIPTYNRSDLLKISLKGALAQDYPNFRVLVLDNASTDDTESVVRSFSDPRITYIRNETNIGLFRNWHRAIAFNSSPYVSILQDDDELRPEFIHKTILALQHFPQAAIAVGGVKAIDINDQPIRLPDDVLPEGKVAGLDFLHGIVAGRNWAIHPSTVMMQASALADVGSFDALHSTFSIDFNLYFRLARKFDMVFIPEELGLVRYHEGQDTQRRLASGGANPLAILAERCDAIAYLLQSDRAQDPSYRQWLAARLLHLSLRRSEITAEFIPNFNLSWAERLQVAIQEIADLIPAGKTILLVDNNEWGCDVLSNHHLVPFLEKDGCYWGAPPDDETAIQELERMRQMGVNFMVIAWSAFWWLDYYSKLREYIHSTFHQLLSNSRIMVFELNKAIQN